jgi:hypothetical protein
MATQADFKIFGTKQFREKFTIPQSSQLEMRKNGMPFYRVPNSSKILYKEPEVLAWLTSQKGVSVDT